MSIPENSNTISKSEYTVQNFVVRRTDYLTFNEAYELVKKYIPNIDSIIPESFKGDRYLLKQVIMHYYPRAKKLEKGKELYPLCEKCREITMHEGEQLFSHRWVRNVYITEHSMVRIYTKSYRVSSGKKWLAVGWICPYCLNVSIDKELVDKNEESRRRIEEILRGNKE